MSEHALTAILGDAVVPQVRTLGLLDLRQSLADGWRDFAAIPTQLLFLGLLYPMVGFIAARAAWGGELLPLVFPLLAGLSLMGPVAALGMYEISRRLEAGEPASWMSGFAVLRSPALGGILILGLVLLIIFGLWIGVAQGIYNATVGTDQPLGLADFLHHVRASPRLVVVGNLVGACFAALVLAISVVSFPMMLDRICSPVLAVRTSLAVVARNPKTMAAWGVIVGVVLVAGAIPALVGLAVAVPLLGHATWHLYRRAVV